MNTQIYFKDFEKIGDIELLSEVGTRLNQDWWIYTGYKKSSELLYQYLKNNWEENESLLDQLVYPIYFNYRTAIEILYKKIVYLFTIDKNIKLNHNILDLHNKLVEILPSKYSIENNSTFIEYLNKIDPKFEKFRYDFTKDGKYSFKNRDQISVEGMIIGFRNSYNALDEIWFDMCIHTSVPERHYLKNKSSETI